MARARGASLIGLAVEITNQGARQLYERLGYREWGHGRVIDQWDEADPAGCVVQTNYDACDYLVKVLGQGRPMQPWLPIQLALTAGMLTSQVHRRRPSRTHSFVASGRRPGEPLSHEAAAGAQLVILVRLLEASNEINQRARPATQRQMGGPLQLTLDRDRTPGCRRCASA